jgi:deferrochelatase/peroxidase EfeB
VTPADTAATSTGDGGAVSGLPRRRFFQGTATGITLGALAGGGTAWGITSRDRSTSSVDADRDLVDLTGQHRFLDQPHPPGIATAPQRHAVYMTFDMVEGSTVADLQTLLARWSAAVSLLMAGRAIGQVRPSHDEAVGQEHG